MAESYKRYIIEEWSDPNLKIWLVDGRQVRETFDLEFIDGGHDKVYPHFIPPNEIWMDGSDAGDELPYDTVHEVYERWLMCLGLDYDTAHEMANKFEKILRDKGDICITSQVIKNFIKRNVEANEKANAATDQVFVQVTIL